jgi:hypothetical protein
MPETSFNNRVCDAQYLDSTLGSLHMPVLLLRLRLIDLSRHTAQTYNVIYNCGQRKDG